MKYYTSPRTMFQTRCDVSKELPTAHTFVVAREAWSCIFDRVKRTVLVVASMACFLGIPFALWQNAAGHEGHHHDRRSRGPTLVQSLPPIGLTGFAVPFFYFFFSSGEDQATAAMPVAAAKAVPMTNAAPALERGNIAFGDDHELEDGTWLTDLPTAQAKAAREDKLVLMDFTGSDWCPPCMMLHDRVLTQRAFLDYASQNLVLVEIDFPRNKLQQTALARANQALKDRFDVEGFPTLILLDGDGKELAREVGLVHENPQEFMNWANKARR